MYSTYIYILLFNGLVLGIGGYSIVGCVAYPYSKQFLQASLKRTTNERFSAEFIKCTDRVVRLVSNMAETQSTENVSAILTALTESTNEQQKGDLESNDQAAFTPVQLTAKEIYNRVAANIELLNLYQGVNQKIIDDDTTNPSRLFRTITRLLREVKQTLDSIQVNVTFHHPWF